MKMLTICKSFFSFLNSNNIRYCHWKSNYNLDNSLNGKTDLDILIHHDDKNLFKRACKKFSVKKIVSPPEKQFPGLEDYLGFDYETGHFIHLHIHYKLVLGQRYIKNHVLPIESLFFRHSILSSQGIKIPCPELELIVLILRAHMKTDILSILKHFIVDCLQLFSGGYTAFPREIENEFDFLIEASNSDKLREILTEMNIPLQPSLPFEFIRRFSCRKLFFYHLIATQLQIFHGLRRYKRQRGLTVYFKYILLYLQDYNPFKKIFFRPKKKVMLDGRGKVITLVGADGSGKSSMIKELHHWLSWKMDVQCFYFGIPKTKSIAIISLFARALRKLHLFRTAKTVEDLLWLHVARVRETLSHQTRTVAAEGKLVLTDRFPLPAFYSMPEPMDGPRIVPQGILGGFFAAIEKRCYDKLQLPDRIFVLQVDLKELRSRKTDLDIDTHKLKAEAVNSIQSDSVILTVDASRSYNEVLLHLKKEIWDLLQ